MKPACDTCGHIHASGDAITLGRFSTLAPVYRASSDVDAPHRATRVEAEADECAGRTTP